MAGGLFMEYCKHDGCTKEIRAFGYCNKHYLRLKKYGSPSGGKRNHGSLERRFWAKVQKSDGCWEWLGGKRPNGYGQISEGGKGGRSLSAHRTSYELHHGPIPEGMVVMHACDNRACVNPDHLSVGSYRDNMADMDAKGRRVIVAPTGEGNGKSILTEQDVLYIRSSPDKSNAQLGREIGVGPNCIRSVRIGRTWRHISG